MTTEPRLFDALALAVQAADELLIRTVRDAHLSSVRRIHGWLRKPAGETSYVIGVAHRAVAGTVYASLGVGLRAGAVGFGAAAALGAGPLLETGHRSRFVRSAVNGLIGDRLARERPRLAIPLALRVHGADVDLTAPGLAAAYPAATGTLVVFVHGLSENEAYWNRGRSKRGRTYADTVVETGGTPVFVRANTGLSTRENGVGLAAALVRAVEHWPVPVTRIVLVGHSMGGLIIRAALGVQGDFVWRDLVTDVVTLGTPHLGAPLAGGVHRAAERLARLPETAGFGRILDQRSVGVHDLVEGIADLPALPGVRYRLVSATLAASPRHPVSRFAGDLLVRQPSAYGVRGPIRLFPDAHVLHLPRADHFDLLNDARVDDALRRWLAG